jgi:hypothetical protein
LNFSIASGSHAGCVNPVSSRGNNANSIVAMSNFPDYSGPLTETILLGNLAVWANGKKIEWDAKELKATNAPEVMRVVKREYRSGWSLG